MVSEIFLFIVSLFTLTSITFLHSVDVRHCIHCSNNKSSVVMWLGFLLLYVFPLNQWKFLHYFYKLVY